MSISAERNAVRSAVAAALLAADATLAVAWDGALNGKPYVRQEGVAFARPRIEDGDGGLVTVGGTQARYRHFATLIVEIYVPVGSGESYVLGVVESLLNYFDRSTFSGVRFPSRGFSRDAGEDAKHRKYQVFLPYYYSEAV